MVVSWEILEYTNDNRKEIKYLQTVYKIVNKLNGRYYIGSTNDIDNRFNVHMNTLIDRYPNSELYQEIHEYGKDNFEMLIIYESENIIEASRIESNMIRENKNDVLMYNKVMGASGRRVLSDEDIIFIRNLYASKQFYIQEAYDKYYKGKVSFRAFKKAWHGDTFKDISYHVYTKENKKFHFSLGQSRRGEVNRSAIFTERDVIDIRKRQKSGEDKQFVKEDYAHLDAPHGFDAIWKGENWKHIIV